MQLKIKEKVATTLKLLPLKPKILCRDQGLGEGLMTDFLIGVGALRVVNQLLQPQERVAGPRGKVPPGID